MRMAKLALAASPISFDVCVPVSTVLASLKSECFLCLFMHMRMAEPALAASPISFDVCVPVSTVWPAWKVNIFYAFLCTCAWQNLHLQRRPFHLMFACLCPQFRPAWKVNIFYSFLCTCAHMRMSKPAFAASPISLYVCVPVSTVLASLKSECFLCFFMHMRTHAHGKTCTRSVAHFI